MKKALLIPLILLITACTNYVDAVKGGKLLLNPAVTIEEALDNYEYFDETNWVLVKEDDYSSQIQFTGVYDFDKFIGVEMKQFGIKITEESVEKSRKKLKDAKLTYTAIFQILKSNGVLSVTSSYINIFGTNQQTGKQSTKNIPDNDLSTLKAIYKNEPELAVMGVLR